MIPGRTDIENSQESVRRVSRIAMKEEDCSGVLSGPRRKQIEAVDAHAIAVKTNLLALDTEIRNVKIDSGARLKNDAVDESTQHEIAE